MTLSRRMMLAGGALLPGLPALAAMPQEGPGTPKICMTIADSQLNDTVMRRIRQLGVDHVTLINMPPLPWTDEMIAARRDRLAAGGLVLGDITTPWVTPTATVSAAFGKIAYALPGRDEEIEKFRASIIAAGQAGVPVLEDNFYAHRLQEGYAEIPGRGGAGMTEFDDTRVKDLPPLPEEGAHSEDEMWTNITYFLKAIIPVAEKANVRMAIHPNDPPAPVSRGSGQIMSTLAGWKRLIEIVPSPANGITFDCGVTRELGEDPVAVCRYFGERDRIAHVHFRNVHTVTPRLNYTEMFPDEGDNDMPAVMRELVRQGYSRMIYPEHPPLLDADRELPKDAPYANYSAWAFNVAYARALLQAALLEEKKR